MIADRQNANRTTDDSGLIKKHKVTLDLSFLTFVQRWNVCQFSADQISFS